MYSSEDLIVGIYANPPFRFMVVVDYGAMTAVATNHQQKDSRKRCLSSITIIGVCQVLWVRN